MWVLIVIGQNKQYDNNLEEEKNENLQKNQLLAVVSYNYCDAQIFSTRWDQPSIFHCPHLSD